MQNINRLLFLFLLTIFLSCSTDTPIEPQSNNEVLQSNTFEKKLKAVEDIIFADDRFTASVFYDNVGGIDGIVPLNNNKLLVVNEFGGPGEAVLKIRRGKSFKPRDYFSTVGDPFVSPDDIVMASDGTVFVADGQAKTVFRINKKGGTPEPFVTTNETTEDFNPFGLAIAPANFDGPNVDPGDIIVTDNAFGGPERAIWAVNRFSGTVKAIVEGVDKFDDGPIRLAFNSEGKLFVILNSFNEESKILNVDAEGVITVFFKPPAGEYIEKGSSLAINPNTNEIYFQYVSGQIWKLSATGGIPSLFASDIGRFNDIEFNKQGTILFLGHRDFNEVIQIKAHKKAWK